MLLHRMDCPEEATRIPRLGAAAGMALLLCSELQKATAQSGLARRAIGSYLHSSCCCSRGCERSQFAVGSRASDTATASRSDSINNRLRSFANEHVDLEVLTARTRCQVPNVSCDFVRAIEIQYSWCAAQCVYDTTGWTKLMELVK